MCRNCETRMPVAWLVPCMPEAVHSVTPVSSALQIKSNVAMQCEPCGDCHTPGTDQHILGSTDPGCPPEDADQRAWSQCSCSLYIYRVLYRQLTFLDSGAPKPRPRALRRASSWRMISSWTTAGCLPEYSAEVPGFVAEHGNLFRTSANCDDMRLQQVIGTLC